MWESTLGQGSRFYVTLPWRPVQEASSPAADDALPAPSIAATTSASILLADDDPTNVDVVAEYLRAHGYAVTVAEDGETALRLCETLQPDLVLMDIHMPKLDGLEATRRIRAHADPAVAATPIIALTGSRC